MEYQANQTLFPTRLAVLSSSSSSQYVPLENNDYTNNELHIYSISLNTLSVFGILFHSLVLCLLISQQIKSRFYFSRQENQNSVTTTNHTANTSTGATCAKFKNSSYKNYVTFAFVFHQIVIDYLRLVYALFYSNSLLIDSKKYVYTAGKSNEIVTLNASQASLSMQFVYDKYCSQMALF